MNISKYLCTISVFFVCCTQVGYSQSISVKGQIIDDTSGRGLSGVHIIVDGSENGTVSDNDGYFELASIASGTHFLLFRSVGYETKEVELEFTDDEPLSGLQVVLKESITLLNGASVEAFTITGGPQNVKKLPGSAHYINPKQLEKFSYNDINRILRNIPGVDIQDEEGFGLRPNIGFRGTGSERSSKITLMEDGIFIAPAPYVAPAAYYFPTAGRMQGIEVRKGSSQIKYGPYTTGGALNLISTAIPNDFFGRVHMFGGSFGKKGLHAFAGNSFDNIGFLIETYQDGSNGFKELDNGNGTGYRTEDYLIKFRLQSSEQARVSQSLTFKAGRYFQDANETYLGLTDEDFAANPLRRYAASQLDNINTDQSQLTLTHYIEPVDFMKVFTSLYHTEFSRNWYKLDKVKANDSIGFVGIASILEDPIQYNSEFQIVKGTSGQYDDALRMKANNRSYWSRGIQTFVQNEFKQGKFTHLIDLGFRYHQDQIDRFQWLDKYRMEDGIMELTQTGIPGTESNRVETARAMAGFVQYNLESSKFNLTPGMRYENIRIERNDYGKNDPEREGNDLNSRENHVRILIPGIGMDLQLRDHLQVFTGIHRGFSPPGSKEGTLPESSINYEFGARLDTDRIRLETVLYYNHYDNLLGADLAASGGTGSGDLFNGGQALVYGSEFFMEFKPRISNEWILPITFTYTFTHAEFQNSFESEFEPWGMVDKGDMLPYIAPHQLVMDISLEHRKFNFNVSSKYTSAMRTEAGTGKPDQARSTDENVVIDVSGQYNPTWRLGLFASVYNLSNATYVVSRRPAGVRPGLPRSLLLGIKSNF